MKSRSDFLIASQSRRAFALSHRPFSRLPLPYSLNPLVSFTTPFRLLLYTLSSPPPAPPSPTMSDKRTSLSIDTSRHPSHRTRNNEKTPSTSTSSLFSNPTPSTGCTVLTPECCPIISQINHFLADLHLPCRPARLNLDPKQLEAVERALPSSPDALRMSDVRAERASLPASQSGIHFEDGVASPLFHHCFVRAGEGKGVRDDAAPFPYSPGRESVFLEARGSLFARLEGSSGEGWVPSIRLEAIDESDVSSEAEKEEESPRSQASSLMSGEASDELSEESGEVEPAKPELRPPVPTLPRRRKPLTRPLRSDSSPTASELLLKPTSPAVPPQRPPFESDSNPTPASGSLHPTPPSLPPLRSDFNLAPSGSLIPPPRPLTRSVSAGNLAATARTPIKQNLLPVKISPDPVLLARTSIKQSYSPIKSSPTSTEILEGVRKVNKLKKLLGEEVCPHVKPLPSLPSQGPSYLQRSNTASTHPPLLGSHKRRAGAGEKERTSEEYFLEFALAGSNLRPKPKVKAVPGGVRPSTAPKRFDGASYFVFD